MLQAIGSLIEPNADIVRRLIFSRREAGNFTIGQQAEPV
jgi:hypothetical protein